MQLRNMGLAATLIVASCTHSLDRSDENEIERMNNEARAALGTADFETAKEIYQRVVNDDTQNPEASFGFALADVLLMPESEPISAFLRECHQPQFRTFEDLFGPEGFFKRARLIRETVGQTKLDVQYLAEQGAEPIPSPFEVDDLGVGLWGYESARTLSVWASTEGSNNDSLHMRFNSDDVYEFDDSRSAPLEEGTVIDLTGFPRHGIDFYSGVRRNNAFYSSDVPLSGTVRFIEFGRSGGDRVVMELTNVVIPAPCTDTDCSASYVINGRIESSLQLPLFETQLLPFGRLQAQRGPPRVDAITQAIEGCSGMDTAYITARLHEVADRLLAPIDYLDSVLKMEDAASFSFAVPKELLHTDDDRLLNITDVAVLKAALELGSAGAELIAQYKYAEGSLADMIDTYHEWGYQDGESHQRIEVRKLKPFLVVSNLTENLLEPENDFDLTKVQQRLEQGLKSAALAFRLEPSSSGVFNLRVPAMQRTADEAAFALDAARESISSSDPKAFSTQELYTIHLKSFFDAPLTRESILIRTGLESLIRLIPGRPEAEYDWDRNDHMELEFSTFAENPKRHLGGLVDYPEDGIAPSILRSGTWEPLLTGGRDDWPIFINTQIRDFAGE